MAPRSASKNPNYAIQIKKNSANPGTGDAKNTGWDEVIATMPEEIALSVQSEYEARYANFFAETMLGRGIKDFQNITGAGLFFQALTQQIWINSDPVELQMQLNFDADEDAYRDVVLPVTKLQSWVMPELSSTDSMVLNSPAPTFKDGEASRCIVHVGRFFTLNSVVIPSVNATFKGAPDKNGQPISATVDITFRTLLTPHRNEFLQYFRNGGPGNENLPNGQVNIDNFTSRLADFFTPGG